MIEPTSKIIFGKNYETGQISAEWQGGDIVAFAEELLNEMGVNPNRPDDYASDKDAYWKEGHLFVCGFELEEILDQPPWGEPPYFRLFQRITHDPQ